MNHKKPRKILFEDVVLPDSGSIFEVYRGIGGGFLEAVYQECLENYENQAFRIVAQQQTQIDILKAGPYNKSVHQI